MFGFTLGTSTKIAFFPWVFQHVLGVGYQAMSCGVVSCPAPVRALNHQSRWYEEIILLSIIREWIEQRSQIEIQATEAYQSPLKSDPKSSRAQSCCIPGLAD